VHLVAKLGSTAKKEVFMKFLLVLSTGIEIFGASQHLFPYTSTVLNQAPIG